MVKFCLHERVIVANEIRKENGSDGDFCKEGKTVMKIRAYGNEDEKTILESNADESQGYRNAPNVMQKM